MVGAQPEEIFFTSSGTESDHWAIWGARAGKLKASAVHLKPHIATSAIEHPAVLKYLHSLQQQVSLSDAGSHTCSSVIKKAHLPARHMQCSAEGKYHPLELTVRPRTCISASLVAHSHVNNTNIRQRNKATYISG